MSHGIKWPCQKHLIVGSDIRKSHAFRTNCLRPTVREGFWATPMQAPNGFQQLTSQKRVIGTIRTDEPITSGFRLIRPEFLPRGSGIEEVLSQSIHCVPG